jgi:hypothetical protein
LNKSAADLFTIVSARGVELWLEAPPRPRTIAAYLLLVIQGNLWPQSDHAGVTPTFDAMNQKLRPSRVTLTFDARRKAINDPKHPKP